MLKQWLTWDLSRARRRLAYSDILSAALYCLFTATTLQRLDGNLSWIGGRHKWKNVMS